MSTIKTPVEAHRNWISDPSRGPIIQCVMADFDTEESIKQRAAELARIINAHGPLVEALKLLRDMSNPNETEEAISKAEAALKLSEGK